MLNKTGLIKLNKIIVAYRYACKYMEGVHAFSKKKNQEKAGGPRFLSE